GLYRRTLSNPEVRPVAGVGLEEGRSAVQNPVFSPDGNSIAFYSVDDSALKKIPVIGGTAVTLCPASPPFGMTWGSEGIVFGQGSGGILQVSADGGKPKQIVTVKKDEQAHGPQILPDGRTILFTLATGLAVNRWDKA